MAAYLELPMTRATRRCGATAGAAAGSVAATGFDGGSVRTDFAGFDANAGGAAAAREEACLGLLRRSLRKRFLGPAGWKTRRLQR
jgi:hypothetical protein